MDNPATGETLAQVAALEAVETARAIAAAEAAWPAWRERPAAERAALLERWHALMLEHQDDLALLMTLEQGKPLAEARGEIAYGASFVKWFAEEARRSFGDILPAPARDRRLPGGDQALGSHSTVGPGAGRTGRSRRLSARRIQRGHRDARRHRR